MVTSIERKSKHNRQTLQDRLVKTCNSQKDDTSPSYATSLTSDSHPKYRSSSLTTSSAILLSSESILPIDENSTTISPQSLGPVLSTPRYDRLSSLWRRIFRSYLRRKKDRNRAYDTIQSLQYGTEKHPILEVSAKNAEDSDMPDPLSEIPRSEDRENVIIQPSLGELFKYQLPRELQMYIIGYLDMRSRCRCARVCRYWRDVTFDGHLWSSLNLSPYYKKLQDRDLIAWISMTGSFLSSLNLRGCLHIDNQVARHIAATCPQLEELNISDCRSLTPFAITSITSACPNLHHLSLSGIDRVNSQCIGMIIQHCRQLRALDLSWCHHLTSPDVKQIFRECHQLEKFSLAGCTLVDDSIFEGMDEYTCLYYVDLTKCERLTDQGIGQLISSSPHLAHLVVSDCRLLTDCFLTHLANKDHLNLEVDNEFYEIDNPTIEKLNDRLEILELARCQLVTDQGLEILTRQCPYLRRLDLEDCIHVTDASLKHFGNRWSRLESIILSCCDKVTDNGLKVLIRGCPRLKQIEIDGCSQINNKTIKRIGQLESLQSLDAFDCQHVSRDSLKRLQQTRPKVRIRSLDWSSTECDGSHRPRLKSSSRKTCRLM